jgi:AraC-like DNA-binding protein
VRKQFRETYHMTPVSYMNQLRINQAKSILLTTIDPISEIAYHCGFTDSKYFTRLFHTSTGFAPLEYRKLYQSLQTEM